MFSAKHFLGRAMPLALRRASAAMPFRRVALAGLVLALGACSRPETGFENAAWRPGAWVPFSTTPNVVTVDSLTAQRVRGNNTDVAAMAPEPGNVWPAQEAPRPTLLGGPEEAFRNVPEYRPTFVDQVPPARSPVPTPQATPQGTIQPPPRGSPGPGAGLPPPQELQRIPAQPAFVAPAAPPPRAEGRVLTDPSGRPAITTGQAGRVQGATQPGIGSSAVVRDGNVETWIGPDGQARTRVVPR
jgi:hypothetical protein